MSIVCLPVARRSEYGSTQPEGTDGLYGPALPQASKVAKTRILNESCAATRLNRKYAITRIHQIEVSRPAASRFHRKRERLYCRDLFGIIEKVWVEADYPWSVRLKAILLLWLPAIRKRRRMTGAAEAQLLRFSPRTIDRTLQGKKRQRKSRPKSCSQNDREPGCRSQTSPL